MGEGDGGRAGVTVDVATVAAAGPTASVGPVPGTPTRPSAGYPSLRLGTRPGPGAGYPLAGGVGWGRGALIGLVWSEGTAGARLGGVAHLVASDGLTHEAPIDELGNFVFEDVAAGAGQLELRLDDAVVVVEDVPIGT